MQMAFNCLIELIKKIDFYNAKIKTKENVNK